MSLRKKRQCLSFADKLNVIKKIKEGESKNKIMQEFGIGKTMFYSLIEQESQVLKNIENFENTNRKSTKTSNESHLDAAMIKWFMQVRDKGDTISGPIVQEKARILNEMLNGSTKFKASNGWLRNFKNRYSIRSVEMKGEKLSNDSESVDEFSQFLREKIDSENLSLENIYNADECGIYWRTLVNCTLVQNLETDVCGHKQIQDRVTALFCANAIGSHRIPLLIIGKSMNPKCLNSLMTPKLKKQQLKLLKTLNVIYTHQSSSWMDRAIFKQWYTDEFIPRVMNHQKSTNIMGKVILILDNAPAHPSLEELNNVHPNFEVIYLPPNVTAMIQPMDQGAISITKKLYKKNLLRRLLIHNEFQSSEEFLKKLDLKDCMVLLSTSWESIKSSTLKSIWKSLLKDKIIMEQSMVQAESSPSFSEEIAFPRAICQQVSKILKGPNFLIEQPYEVLRNWFETDNRDCGWEPMSDECIINSVTNGQNYAQEVDEIEENNTDYDESHKVSEAMESLKKLKKWMKSCKSISQDQHQCIAEIEALLIKENESLQDKIFLSL